LWRRLRLLNVTSHVHGSQCNSSNRRVVAEAQGGGRGLYAHHRSSAVVALVMFLVFCGFAIQLINLEHDPATLVAISGGIRTALAAIEKIYTVSWHAINKTVSC
ncbi:unnamed protein product, partial [Aureobasidium vineae]